MDNILGPAQLPVIIPLERLYPLYLDQTVPRGAAGVADVSLDGGGP